MSTDSSGLGVLADSGLVRKPCLSKRTISPPSGNPVARAAIDAYDILSEADDLAWTYVAPAALIEPGERTGEYRTAERRLVTDEAGDSYISMEDFAIALVDELEESNAVHTYLGTGH